MDKVLHSKNLKYGFDMSAQTSGRPHHRHQNDHLLTDQQLLDKAAKELLQPADALVQFILKQAKSL